MAPVQEHCRDLPKGTPPLRPEEAETMLRDLPAWRVEGKSLVRGVRLRDFAAAVAVVQEIARVAEAEGHHPDLHITGYRDLRIELSTHSVGGLSHNDVILARLLEPLVAGGP